MGQVGKVHLCQTTSHLFLLYDQGSWILFGFSPYLHVLRTSLCFCHDDTKGGAICYLVLAFSCSYMYQSKHNDHLMDFSMCCQNSYDPLSCAYRSSGVYGTNTWTPDLSCMLEQLWTELIKTNYWYMIDARGIWRSGQCPILYSSLCYVGHFLTISATWHCTLFF